MTPQEVVKSLTLTYTEQNLLAAGYCPKCEQPIRGEFIPVPDGAGFMRPEIYEALREGGIDSASGHKANCELKGLRLP